METKKDNITRHNALKKLIKEHPIEDQETLVELLKKYHNIATTQSIVSRDLRALGISKRIRGSVMVYDLPTIDVSKEILVRAIVDVDFNDSLIVVKTLAGMAAFVGDYLDQQDNLNLLGTLAGENNVFVAPKKSVPIAHAYKAVCAALYFKHKDIL